MRGVAATVALALLLGACSDAGESSGAPANLGIAGASCVRSPDCQAPLQCIDQVCVDPNAVPDAEPDAQSDVEPDARADADAREQADLPVVHDIDEFIDVAGFDYIDDPDGKPSDEDTGVPDGLVDPFSDCEALGIGPDWQGAFLGEIDFDLDSGGLVTPEQGTIFVQGSLAFTIECIDSKLVVNGQMDGTATVEGQGDFPFVMKISGFYSPKNGKLTTQIVDGVVTIYDLIEVYFEGELGGDLHADETFTGTWTGYSTGTNQEAITGTAQGDGSWNASEP